MDVSEVMTKQPVSLEPTSTCGEAAVLMKQEDCGSLPILENGRLVGIVTDRDIVVRAIAAGKDPKRTSVAEVMSSDPVTTTPEASLDDASGMMADRQIRRLPVVEDGRLVGMLVMAHVARRTDERETGATLREVSEPRSEKASHARG